MKYVVAFVAAASPFAYLFGPALLANVAVFAFWLLWGFLFVGGLARLSGHVTPNDERPSLAWRSVARLVVIAAIIALAAHAHYAMAALMLAVMVLSLLARQKAKEAATDGMG